MLLARIRGLFRSREAGRIDEEIAAHVDLMAADLVRRGMAPDAAVREARRQFGGTAQVAESWRDQRSLPIVETFAKDLRFSARQLRANPGFTAAAVLTLALGIGANTAIFRVLDAVVLRSLPVRQPEKLVFLRGYTNGKFPAFNYPLFREMEERQQSAEGMFAFCDFPSKDEDLTGRLVTGGYFRVLGVEARVGRVFTNEDDRPSAAPVAVISYAYWQRAFGGKVEALGQTLKIDRAVVTIVGVTPPEFFGERVGSAPDVWVPMNLAPQVFYDLLHSPAYSVLTVMARLRPNVSQSQARAELNGLFGQSNLHMHFSEHDEYRLELEPASQGVRDLQEKFSRPLTVLMGIVGLVLLIACSNLANLLLARSAARTHEMGVRLALGAGRGRLIRQLLTESLLLTLLGSLAGFALAAWGSHALVTLASAGQNWKLAIDGGWRVVAFTAGVSLAAACLFGLTPALAATRLDVSAALQSNGRTHSGTQSRQATLRAFVVAQVALSLLLVSGASLLVRSFWNIGHQDFGYRREGVLWVRVPFAPSSWRLQRPVLESVYERLNRIPGVTSAAIAAAGPMGNVQNPALMSVAERPAQESDEARLVQVTGRYFETMGIPILAGRPLTDADREGNARVAVVSETAARLMFGRVDRAVGRYYSNGKQFETDKAVEIVGVAHDIRFGDAREPFSALLYEPIRKQPGPISSLVLRTAGDPTLFASAAREAIREVAPTLRIGEIRPFDAIIGDSLRQERMMALISGVFGVLALVLASVGLYGVIAYGVERRTQEIGIRLALGASRLQVSKLLLGELGLVLSIGLLLGGAATVALGQSVKALLFGLTPHDPLMLAAAAGLLTIVAVAAGYVPARRAGRMDPVQALRQE